MFLEGFGPRACFRIFLEKKEAKTYKKGSRWERCSLQLYNTTEKSSHLVEISRVLSIFHDFCVVRHSWNRGKQVQLKVYQHYVVFNDDIYFIVSTIFTEMSVLMITNELCLQYILSETFSMEYVLSGQATSSTDILVLCVDET